MGTPEAFFEGLLKGGLSAWFLFPFVGALVLTAGGLRRTRARRPRRSPHRHGGLVVDLTPRRRPPRSR
jgi:hypothetical protein